MPPDPARQIETIEDARAAILAAVPTAHHSRLRFAARRRPNLWPGNDNRLNGDWIYEAAYLWPGTCLRVDALTAAGLVRQFAETIAPEIALTAAIETIRRRLANGFEAEIWTNHDGVGRRFTLIVYRCRTSFVIHADTLDALVDRFYREILPAAEAEITSPHLPPPPR